MILEIRFYITSLVSFVSQSHEVESRGTAHINVRYFYITDQFKAEDISRINYKPTRDKESDYLTKALEGRSFHTYLKTLMGLDGINEHMFYEKYKNKKNPSN